MDRQADPYRTFVIGLGSALAAVLTVVFAINSLVDPLWHFGGNRFGDINHRFEERRMKLNQLLNDPGRYDCLIVGSSRTTLLDEELIGDAKCFNMAVSLGHVREFVLISEYLRDRGFRPRRVIVGVDEVSFQRWAYTDGEKLPEYVVTGERPDLSFEDYLGVTTLRFSYQTLFDPPRFFRAYERRPDGTFRCIVYKREINYDPPKHAVVAEDLVEPYDPAMVAEFEALRNVFPDAEYIGYVPPVSDWSQADMDLTGNLERYIDLRHSLAPLFEGGFYDYSIPSALTADRSQTYDGEHYTTEVNDVIARCLGGDGASCATDVRTLTLDRYRDLILPTIRSRIEREGLTITVEKGRGSLPQP